MPQISHLTKLGGEFEAQFWSAWPKEKQSPLYKPKAVMSWTCRASKNVFLASNCGRLLIMQGLGSAIFTFTFSNSLLTLNNSWCPHVELKGTCRGGNTTCCCCAFMVLNKDFAKNVQKMRPFRETENGVMKKNRCHVTALKTGLRRIHPAPGKDLNYILRTNKKAT